MQMSQRRHTSDNPNGKRQSQYVCIEEIEKKNCVAMFVDR